MSLYWLSQIPVYLRWSLLKMGCCRTLGQNVPGHERREISECHHLVCRVIRQGVFKKYSDLFGEHHKDASTFLLLSVLQFCEHQTGTPIQETLSCRNVHVSKSWSLEKLHKLFSAHGALFFGKVVQAIPIKAEAWSGITPSRTPHNSPGCDWGLDWVKKKKKKRTWYTRAYFLVMIGTLLVLLTVHLDCKGIEDRCECEGNTLLRCSLTIWWGPAISAWIRWLTGDGDRVHCGTLLPQDALKDGNILCPLAMQKQCGGDQLTQIT